MRKVLAGLVLGIAAIGVAVCTTMTSGLAGDRELYMFHSKADDVEFGMSKSRVQYIMGQPLNRVYEGNQEAWLLCQTSSSPKFPDAFLTVYFYRAQVAGIHTYGNRAEGTCDNFLRRVEWLPDPEKSMAAKVRRRD